MSISQAFRVLGLQANADRSEVRETYRRLAFTHHPDRNGGRSDSLDRFKQLTNAYKVLEGKFRVDSRPLVTSATPGECERCGQYATRLKAMDGNLYCANCATSGRGRPALPAPPVVIVSCGFAVAMLVVSIVCIFLRGVTGKDVYTLAAVGAGLAVNASLLVVCVTVVQIAGKRELRKRK